MVTSAKEYREKNTTKEVTLPSGAVFTIRKASAMDSLDENFPIKNIQEIIGDNVDEKNQMRAEKMTSEERKETTIASIKLMLLMVVSPKIEFYKPDNDDDWWIRDLTKDDFDYLMKEINNFSFGGGASLRRFSDDGKSVNP